MAEQLGDWVRTHTCGALRTDDLDSDATLLGWVHRVRDLGGVLFIDIRDREGVSQIVVQGQRRPARAGQAAPARVRRRREGARGAPFAGDGESEARHRRGGSARARTAPVERGEDAAVPDRRGLAGVRGRAAEVPLPGSAAPAAAGEHRPPPQGRVCRPRGIQRAGLLGDRDADSHQVDAGRRARLPGARAACIPASSTRCRSRRRSSSRS